MFISKLISIIRGLLLIILALILIFLCLVVYVKYLEPNYLTVKNYDVESGTKENSLKLTIFSDTHYKQDTSKSKMEKIINKINAENADIVIFLGDLVDSYTQSTPDMDHVTETLKNINAKYGKYSIYGNHDHGGGMSRLYRKVMTDSNFVLLENSIIYIQELGVKLLGLDDALLGAPDKSLVESVSDSSYNIALIHEPDYVDQLNLSYLNMVLSGHTHGGQVNLPYIKDKALPELGRIYVKGQFNLKSNLNTKLIVTSGIGTTKLPIRFLNVPEIVSINIKY